MLQTAFPRSTFLYCFDTHCLGDRKGIHPVKKSHISNPQTFYFEKPSGTRINLDYLQKNRPVKRTPKVVVVVVAVAENTEILH